jgi:hypothetical protein
VANTQGGIAEPFLSSWIIHTYDDLFLNVGYQLKAGDLSRRQKMEWIEVLISLLDKIANADTFATLALDMAEPMAREEFSERVPMIRSNSTSCQTNETDRSLRSKKLTHDV